MEAEASGGEEEEEDDVDWEEGWKQMDHHWSMCIIMTFSNFLGIYTKFANLYFSKHTKGCETKWLDEIPFYTFYKCVVLQRLSFSVFSNPSLSLFLFLDKKISVK